MTSAAVLHRKNPPSPAGFLVLYESSGRTIRDVLCPALHAANINNAAPGKVRPLVPL
jgi:hypothetical protein